MNPLFKVGDIITVAGVFRDGAMDETRRLVTENVQAWRVVRLEMHRSDAVVLDPVLLTGEPDVESWFFGRETRIDLRGGVVTRPIARRVH